MIPTANMASAYVHLGLAFPGTCEIAGDGYWGCLGTFPHTASNFAFITTETGVVSDELILHARERSVFTVYRSSSPAAVEPSPFRLQYRLLSLSSDAPLLPDREATFVAGVDRLKVANFITEQFVRLSHDRYRKELPNALATAAGLQLAAISEGGRMVGAMMLHHTAEALGLYNLCVDPSWRRRGIGGDLVRMALAYAEGKPVVLQCEASLESWYRRFEFARIGVVDALVLDSGRADAIIRAI